MNISCYSALYLEYVKISKAYAVFLGTFGNAHHVISTITYNPRQIRCNTKGPTFWAVTPVKNGATRPPGLPTEAMMENEDI
jgi:hypothetical protein